MTLERYHIIYFIGIGGIGMSALARWFKYHGHEVYGYDLTPTALTDCLQEEGIAVHFQDTIEAIPSAVLQESERVLVVYTPAIPQGHKGFELLRSKGYPIKKRSEVLGMLTENQFTIAVAGTHGKTTTSTMITHILHYAGRGCNAFLGGISNNLGSNLLISEKRADESVMVVEADEYDRSFLTLHPNIAVVTAADADHLDIYGDKNAVNDSFKAFIDQLVSEGILVLKEGLTTLKTSLRKDIKVLPYALEGSERRADNLIIEEDIFRFDYVAAKGNIPAIRLKVPGYHNVENAVAAITVALQLGIAPDIIREALEAFKGVRRRFDYILRKPNVIYIDDYAHHPVEIEAFLGSVKALYPEKKLTAVFQPHLFSRTRDFLEDFAKSLSLADEVILMDIYPAREMPIPGISSQLLLERINSKEKRLLNKEGLLNLIKENEPEVLVTMGAGNIDRLVQPIKTLLTNQYEQEKH